MLVITRVILITVVLLQVLLGMTFLCRRLCVVGVQLADLLNDAGHASIALQPGMHLELLRGAEIGVAHDQLALGLVGHRLSYVLFILDVLLLLLGAELNHALCALSLALVEDILESLVLCNREVASVCVVEEL